MTLQRIKRLKYEYCRHLDSGNVSDFVDLFTEDAYVEVPNHEPCRGIEEVQEFITDVSGRDIDLMSHMASNPIVDVDGDEATGHWYYIVIIEDGDGQATWGQGRWEDRYRRVDGDWKIASLVATRQFTSRISE